MIRISQSASAAGSTAAAAIVVSLAAGLARADLFNPVGSVDMRVRTQYSNSATGPDVTTPFTHTGITDPSFSQSVMAVSNAAGGQQTLFSTGHTLAASAAQLQATMTTRMAHPAMSFGQNSYLFDGQSSMQWTFTIAQPTTVAFTSNFSPLFTNASYITFATTANVPVFSQATAPPVFFPASAQVTLAPGNYKLGMGVFPTDQFPQPNVNSLPASDVTFSGTIGLAVVPTPSAAGLLALTGMLAARRRSR